MSTQQEQIAKRRSDMPSKYRKLYDRCTSGKASPRFPLGHRTLYISQAHHNQHRLFYFDREKYLRLAYIPALLNLLFSCP